VGGAMGQILSTSFYAKGNTQTPTRIGVIGFTIGLFFKGIGFYIAGVTGIAVGTSLYLLMNAFFMQYFLSKNLNTLAAKLSD
jgi:peptidoglycan biosynthesis protein MviN/MurJ (putative lipid II flippase)